MKNASSCSPGAPGWRIEKDFLPFNNGTKATITVLPAAGSLVVR